MKNTKIFTAIIVAFLFTACTQNHEDQLIGLWQGSDLMIKNDTLKMDSSVLKENLVAHKGTTYEFKPDHNFEVRMIYKSNLSISNGKWALDKEGKILSITDTVSGMNQQHRIDELSEENLTLRSNFNFGETTVKFKKK